MKLMCSFLEHSCEAWLVTLTKQFSMSQYETTQESQSQFEMPYSRKRSRSNSYAASSRPGYKRLRYTAKKPITRPGAAGNRCIIPVTHSVDFYLTADPAFAYSFDTGKIYVNGAAGATIAGCTEIAAVFDMARLMKVDVTIIPSANSLDYPDQTVGSGVTNIPFMYTCVDWNDNVTPTFAEVQQNATCQVARLDKVFKRTFYPRLEGSNGIIDVGLNERNKFMHTTAASTQHWNGFKMFIDMAAQVWTYGSGRIVFKLYYECMQSK